MKKNIRQLHLDKLGKVSDKWESYLDYYDSLLYRINDNQICMLEIGVQNGGSLETWAEYFSNGAIFIGCDVDSNCEKLKYSDNRISIVIGDANSQETFNKITSITSSFDLIIDDGSHRSNDIINSFINYFPLVKPGGIYIIEDAHCLYMKDFGGGIYNEFSSQFFFKKIIDLINYQWWSSVTSLSNVFQTFFPGGDIPNFITEGWIDSIEFKNSLITIKKSGSAGHEKLGARIITGTESLVQDWGGNTPK
jgi:hypothetical protein